MTKTARIELRAAPEQEQRIRSAAGLVNQSMTAFMLAAAVERADAVIATWSTTTVSPEFFDQLLQALDQPPTPNQELAGAVQRRRAALHQEVA